MKVGVKDDSWRCMWLESKMIAEDVCFNFEWMNYEHSNDVNMNLQINFPMKFRINNLHTQMNLFMVNHFIHRQIYSWWINSYTDEFIHGESFHTQTNLFMVNHFIHRQIFSWWIISYTDEFIHGESWCNIFIHRIFRQNFSN